MPLPSIIHPLLITASTADDGIPWAWVGAGVAAGIMGTVLFLRRKTAPSANPMPLMAPDMAIFRLRLLPDDGLKLEALSGACETLLGHPGAWYQELPLRFLDQLPAEDRKTLLRAVRRSVIDRRPRAARCRLRLCNEDRDINRHVLFHAMPTGDRAQLVLEGFLIDWSAEAAEEENRIHFLERLEQVQRRESLGLLASGIAHDFNNILSAIRGNAELIAPSVPDGARPRVKRLLDAVDRAAGLVRQILAYAGRGTVERRPIDLATEVEQLVALIQPGQPNHITFDLHLARDLPSVVMDPAQFQQVATNLLVNAAESYQGGPGVVMVSLGQEGGACVLRITDRGCGIDPAVREHIFEPYFTTKPQGHGLGLAAVQGIVTAVGGSIACTSEVGRGTAFTVRLPIRTASASIRVPTPMTDEPTTAEAVLVADDDEAVREALVDMLTSLGYVCLAADGGLACQRLLRERRKHICALVLDCRMPDVDGIDILSDLRTRGDRIPVILVSGMVSADHLGDRLRDRRTRFLAKPFTKIQLATTLDVMFGSSRNHPAPEPGMPTTPQLVHEIIRSRAQRET